MMWLTPEDAAPRQFALYVETVLDDWEVCHAIRDVDTDLLAKYGEVGVDPGFKSAKYRVARPAVMGCRDENDTVDVHPSGKVVCRGAKSVERAART